MVEKPSYHFHNAITSFNTRDIDHPLKSLSMRYRLFKYAPWPKFEGLAHGLDGGTVTFMKVYSSRTRPIPPNCLIKQPIEQATLPLLKPKRI